MRLYFFLACTISMSDAAVPPDHAERMTRGLELFRTGISAVLKEHCVDCHGGAKTKGDLDLATREGLLLGGADGKVVVPFVASESRLLKLIDHAEEPWMPEKKPKLSAETIASIAQWIDLGAPYDGALVAGKRAPRDRSKVGEADRQWWSFLPLPKVNPPAGAIHPVDAFLLTAAQEKGLTMNPGAEPRVLLRRAALDIAGLPPQSGSRIAAAFIAAPSELAWKKYIDELLASPAYGERWARHWLDVARFAESSGFEHDYDRPYAWHYRDFVIRALNEDMPFDQFARWQLAGDEIAPGNAEALMATGFLGAGVFPTQITANEVERTRYDAMDDMLSTTGSAFLGLTVGCARCHDHKFDPIPAKDYYQMLSTFTSTVRSNIDLPADPGEYAKAMAEHESAGVRMRAELAAYGKSLEPSFSDWLAKEPGALAEAAWTVLEPEKLTSTGGAVFRRLEDSSWLVEGPNADFDTYSITAQTSLRNITGLKLEALSDGSLKASGPGRADNGNFALSRIRVAAQDVNGGAAREIRILSAQATHEQNKDHLSVASALDDTPQSGWAIDAGGIGKDQAAAFTFAEPVDFPDGCRITITLVFGVNTRHAMGRLRFSLCKGGVPELKADSLPAGIGSLLARGSSLAEGERGLLFDWWKQRDASWKAKQEKLSAHEKAKPDPNRKVMICAEGYEPLVMHSQGPPFLAETHLLKRGDPVQKQEVVSQGFLQVLTRGADVKGWQWAPPPGVKYSGRRRSLANWMTDVEHGAGALMARVTVNRLWQHHFGRGLVSTPNDFGKTGALPSHPALLDWLAGELIRNGWKLKPLHRLIMTSAAYQQSAASDAATAAADPGNRFFLRRMPRRLEAEAVRDSGLAVSGLLDSSMYGPGTLDENSRRRSIYFKVKRSQLVNSMVVFDAPEPLTSQGSRPTTTVAPQALMMMNSPQVRQWAEALARRLSTGDAAESTAAAVTGAYLITLGRPPGESELAAAGAFLREAMSPGAGGEPALDREAALTDFCQMILSLNEFVYTD